MVQGVSEVGCLAHARRKFFDLHASNKSQIAHSALEQIARVYDIEREVKELPPDERRRIRQEKSKPLLDALHQWMILNRQKITDGTATAKALDYSLRRWSALTRFLSDGQLPVDNNHIHADIGMNMVIPTPGLCRFKVKNLDSNSRSTVCVSA